MVNIACSLDSIICGFENGGVVILNTGYQPVWSAGFPDQDYTLGFTDLIGTRMVSSFNGDNFWRISSIGTLVEYSNT